MALEMLTPLRLVASRFIISGSILLLVAAARGTHLPRGRELWTACATGVLILGFGSGCLAFAEVLIPSGLAGLIITISPFWLIGLEALLPGGERLHAPTIFGMAVGLLGAAVLLMPDLQGYAGNKNLLNGFLILQLGMAGWSYGSVYQKRQVVRAHPIILGAVQQLAAGLAFVPLALLFPGPPIRWSTQGIGAILYLVTCGSIVGYSAYVYALDRLPVAIVSIYPYVNAIVAVALGWLFYREPFGRREALAMAIIFAGVTIVKLTQPLPQPATAAEEGSPGAPRSGSVLARDLSAERASSRAQKCDDPE